jgi:hypothetical protein
MMKLPLLFPLQPYQRSYSQFLLPISASLRLTRHGLQAALCLLSLHLSMLMKECKLSFAPAPLLQALASHRRKSGRMVFASKFG